MKNLSIVLLAAMTVIGLFAIAVLKTASADQAYKPQGMAANYSTACDFGGATAQAIAVTGTAAQATATGTGNVRIVCSTDSHFLQGVRGVTGVTALTGSSLIPANTVEYINADRSTFSFLRDVSSGTCYLTECK